MGRETLAITPYLRQKREKARSPRALLCPVDFVVETTVVHCVLFACAACVACCIGEIIW